MTSPTGGRWILSVEPNGGFSGVILGINNGVAPTFPPPVPGKANVEIFTNPSVSGVPGPGPGFQFAATDPNGTLTGGFLTGTNLTLGGGDFLAVDSVTGSPLQSGSKMTLGSGKQTVVGAQNDTLIGGSGNQILSALLGNETVIGGSGNESIWGGANDSIVGGTGADQQIVVTGKNTTVVAGLSGKAIITTTNNDTVRSLGGSTQDVIIAAGANNLIDLTGNKAANASAVIGSGGDTITAGSGVTNIEGSAGAMQIKVGAGGTTNLSGSTSSVTGNTVIGGGGNFNFNPGSVAGKGDRFDLSNSLGQATINAFAFQGKTVAAADTVLAGKTADSVFGGNGDVIGIGTVQGAGSHQWTADTVASSSVGFGTFSTVTGSQAKVTVGGFNTADDFLFYQNETQAQNQQIVATAQTTTIVTPGDSVIVNLPDGTVMTLVGVTQAQLAGVLNTTLFKVQGP